MSNKVLDNSRISKHLGQTSQYKDQYDPDLLVNEPRSNNRIHLNIHDDDLPFTGYDTWNAYEVSALTNNGLPVAGVAKVIYPCDSKYIVESKSIKLYFNSFNMYRCGDTPEQVLNNIDQTAAKDLSNLLETQVIVKTFPADYIALGDSVLDRNKYTTLESTFEQEYLMDMKLDTYTETPELLEIQDESCDGCEYSVWDKSRTCRWHSSLLKSNCRVTSQPDWGDVYVMYKGHHHVSPESLLKYIVSFRDECHFHEEICETIYKRLHDALTPVQLCVTCLYARRGGIDINPVRASNDYVIQQECKSLIDPEVMHIKTAKQ
jgi:7-cyano-7-deazaguanine reductase